MWPHHYYVQEFRNKIVDLCIPIFFYLNTKGGSSKFSVFHIHTSPFSDTVTNTSFSSNLPILMELITKGYTHFISIKKLFENKNKIELAFTDSDPPPICRALGLTKLLVLSLNGENIVSSVYTLIL